MFLNVKPFDLRVAHGVVIWGAAVKGPRKDVFTRWKERAHKRKVQDVQWITRERQSSSFVRQLNLGQGIDIQNIAANYDNGVLTVTIPVSAQAKPRKIQVVSGQGEQQALGEGRDESGDRVIGEGELVNGAGSTQSTEG